MEYPLERQLEDMEYEALSNAKKLRDELEKKDRIIQKLEEEVFRLEEHVRNWKELYLAEKAQCDDYRWADDSRNGRLQDGR